MPALLFLQVACLPPVAGSEVGREQGQRFQQSEILHPRG